MQSPRHPVRLLLLTWIALLYGCATPPAEKSYAELIPTVTNNEDQSLMPLDYVELGMPASDRTWSESDIARVYAVLAPLAAADARQLPRYKSPRSGAVFSRLTSRENLRVFRSPNVPHELRFSPALNFLDGNNKIMSLYLAAFAKNAVTGNEIVELMGSLFRATVVLLDLVDEHTPKVRKDDPLEQVRIQGIASMKSGLATLVAGGLQSVADQSYTIEERLRLVDHIGESFPTIIARLTPESRKEMLLHIDRMANDPSLGALQGSMRSLQARVQRAVKDAG